MQQVSIQTEFIRLDQFLKLVQLVSGGGEAKLLVKGGAVAVNGETEIRRGRKLRDGDRIMAEGETYRLRRQPR